MTCVDRRPRFSPVSTVCAAGSYASGGVCVACTIGTYSAAAGSASCTTCTAPLTTQNTASADVSLCGEELDVRLGTHSQRRSNQRRAAPLCCGVAPLGLYGGCCYITPTTLGVVGAMQKQPNADPMGRRNSMT